MICAASENNTTVIKFVGDTTVIGLITSDEETAYRREMAEPVGLVPGKESLLKDREEQGDDD